MITICKNILNKAKKEDKLTYEEELERNYNQLKENVIHSQEIAKIGSWTYDIQSGERFFTDEVYNILDSSSEECICRIDDYLSFVHPEDREELRKITQKTIDEGKEYDIEYRIISGSGAEKYVHERTKVVYYENDNPIKMVGIIQDITMQKLIENNLKAIGDYLNQAQGIAGIGSFKYDAIKNEVLGSEEALKIYGIDPIQLKKDADSFIKLIHPEDQAKIRKGFDNCLKGKPYNLKLRVPQMDGTNKYIVYKGNPLYNDNNIVGVIGTVQDITKFELLQIELKNKHKRLANAERIAGMASWELDIANRRIYLSEEAHRIFGIGTDQFDESYEGFLRFIHPDDKDLINDILENPAEEPLDMEFRIIGLDGSINTLYVQREMISDNDGNPITVYGTTLDITERVEMENIMEHIANHDELTGLPNSHNFKEKLSSQFENAYKTKTRFALMMLEIDGLKNINYSLGYDVGSQAIIEIVQKMRMFLGKEIFLSRFSDDHFALIIQGYKTIGEYDDLAKGLINLLSKPTRVYNYDLDFAANIGICYYTEKELSVDSFRKHAKIALLNAKKEGKDTYKYYSSDLDIKHYKEITLRNDLHHIIEKEQLKVYYQPIVNIKTNEILAVEALARWDNPEWGIVSPDEFIPLAEETGFIIEIGKWMLKEVCGHYKKWLSYEIPNFKISINLSSIQFLEKDFVENIESIIAEYELDPSFLIIEITEGILINNPDKVNSDIEELQSLGIQVALDDFGTGYASLSYLMSFKIDILKIDESFVRNISSDETSSVITRNIINMAGELKIELVAEGIENWEQLSALKEYKCFAGQGYIYSKPIPMEDIEPILAKGKCKPILANDLLKPIEERRKFFRIKFSQLLEADMTIREIKGRRLNIGKTKILIEDIGPGGMRFISNIILPLEKDVILQFITQLIGRDINVHGYLVWMEESGTNLYEYGVEFIVNENERADLIMTLNQVQIKMKNDILFAEGSFTSFSPDLYFKRKNTY